MHTATSHNPNMHGAGSAWQHFPQIRHSGQHDITLSPVNIKAHILLLFAQLLPLLYLQVGNPQDYLLNIAQRNGSWGPPKEMPANRCAAIVVQVLFQSRHQLVCCSRVCSRTCHNLGLSLALMVNLHKHGCELRFSLAACCFCCFRTMYTITRSSKGGADVTAAAAAALAATYEVFKSTDPTYASSALKHAQELYALATNLPVNATYCAEVACFEGLKSGGYRWKAYLSESVYDDLALAAAWLYKATGELEGCAASVVALYSCVRPVELWASVGNRLLPYCIFCPLACHIDST